MKRKNTFKKSCMTTFGVLFIATSTSLGMDSSTLTQAVPGLEGRDKNTQQFIPQNFKVIETLRDFYQEHGEKSLVEHHSILVPFADYLVQKMNIGLQNKYIERLKKEIICTLEDREVSAIWLIGMHIRYIYLLGEPSLEEVELFDHTPSQPGYFKAFLQKDISGNPAVLNIYKISQCLYKADNGERFIKKIFVPGLSNKVKKEINCELKKNLPLPILYPLLDEGILHPKFIINCWMDEVYPIGFPTKSVPSVHGENATPIGFAYHDYFHYKIDTRRQIFKTFIQLETIEAIKKGIWASDFILKFVPLVIKKYHLFMSAIKKAYKNVENDKYAFTGLFFMVHEFPYFSVELFKKPNPSEIFETMLKGSLENFNEDESWHNPMDVLRTNPVNGMTFSTDQEIKQAALERALKDNTFMDYAFYLYNFHNEIKDRVNIVGHIEGEQEIQCTKKDYLIKNTRFDVKKSPQFIDVNIQLSNGHQKIYTFPTLYRKWKNFEASSGMLKFAGISIVQPQFTTDIVENREVATNFIKLVNDKIKEVMEDFVAKTKVSFGEENNSYLKSYANEFADIEAQILLLSNESSSNLFPSSPTLF